MSAQREASTALWAMFIVVVALQVVLAMVQHGHTKRLEAAERRVDAIRQELIGRMALQEEQHNGCASALADWQRWLDLRAEGHGAAWFLRRKPEEVAP